MDSPLTEKSQINHNSKMINNLMLVNKLQLLFLGLLSLGFFAYFVSHDHWLKYVFGHIIGIGFFGFFGCLSGFIARKKGLSYWKAFNIGFFVPLITGVIGGLLFGPAGETVSCGAPLGLIVGILVVISYVIAGRAKRNMQTG